MTSLVHLLHMRRSMATHGALSVNWSPPTSPYDVTHAVCQQRWGAYSAPVAIDTVELDTNKF